MDNNCEKKACGWLILLVIIAGFAALYMLLDKRLPSATAAAAEAKCEASKEIKLSDYGRVISMTQDGGTLRVVLGKDEDGVYNAITIDTCSNEVKSKVTIRSK